MTTVTVKYKHKNIVSIEANGHANFKRKGKDIVCAAVSVLMQTAVEGLVTVAKIDQIIFESEEKTAYMYIELPIGLTDVQNEHAGVILDTITIGLQGIANAYPKNMKLYKEGGANIQ
jgi:hypothetical protein